MRLGIQVLPSLAATTDYELNDLSTVHGGNFCDGII